MSTPMILVPGRRSARSAVWWCWTPGPTVYAPRVTLSAGRVVTTVDLQHGPFLILLDDLPPDAEVTMTVEAGPERRELRFRTWKADADVFRVAIGSCYLLGKDTGYVADGYASLLAKLPMDLRVLAGDQIYMDFDPRDGTSYAERGIYDAPLSVQPFERYRGQWGDARWRRFLEATPTMTLADDHEFWNGYPSHFPFLSWTQHPGSEFEAQFHKAFDVFQSSLNATSGAGDGHPDYAAEILGGRFRTTTVKAPVVSLFMLDTRTRRDRPGGAARFCPDEDLDRLERWARGLTRPGVLFTGQPPTDGGGVYFRWFTRTFDSALVNYRRQYERLWSILGDPTLPHDVMVVSGDIHWNRLRKATARSGRVVWEFVSSGMTHDSDSPDAPGPAHYHYETNGAMPFGCGTFATAPGTRANWDAKIGTLEFRRRADGGADVEAVTWPLRDAALAPLRAGFTLR